MTITIIYSADIIILLTVYYILPIKISMNLVFDKLDNGKLHVGTSHTISGTMPNNIIEMVTRKYYGSEFKCKISN